jgi:hypothetical protein
MKSKLFCRSVIPSRWLAAMAVASVVAQPLMAQEKDQFRFAVGVGYRADADIDRGGGDFNETRFSVSGSRTFTLNDRLQLEPIVAYRFSAYDFSRPDPWDDIHTFRATLLARYAFDQTWSIFGGPSIGLSGESDADAEDAITFGGALGVSYRVRENLSIGAGFTASTEIEDDARIRPLVIVNWQINNAWSAESGYLDVAGAAGPGGEVRYRINESWSVAGGVLYHEKRFRLSDDARGRLREGVGEDSSFPIYGKVTWQVCANAALELVGGVSTSGELLIEDRNGHKITKTDYDAAPLMGVRAVLSF